MWGPLKRDQEYSRTCSLGPEPTVVFQKNSYLIFFHHFNHTVVSFVIFNKDVGVCALEVQKYLLDIFGYIGAFGYEKMSL